VSERAYRASPHARAQETTTFGVEESVTWTVGGPRAVGGHGYVAAVQRPREPLRERLIAAGVLRPSPNEALAEHPRDRLAPLQIPSWWPVFRLVDDRSRWS
jgi:hypothetical protein